MYLLRPCQRRLYQLPLVRAPVPFEHGALGAPARRQRPVGRQCGDPRERLLLGCRDPQRPLGASASGGGCGCSGVGGQRRQLLELLLVVVVVDRLGALEGLEGAVHLAAPQEAVPGEGAYVLWLDGLADDVLSGGETRPGVNGVVEPVGTDDRNPHVLASLDVCV